MNERSRLHYSRYLANVALAQRMEAALPDALDWSCVILFYAALHVLGAYLTTKRNVDFPSAAHDQKGKPWKPVRSSAMHRNDTAC